MFEQVKVLRRLLTVSVVSISLLLLGDPGSDTASDLGRGQSLRARVDASLQPTLSRCDGSTNETPANRASCDGETVLRLRRGSRASVLYLGLLVGPSATAGEITVAVTPPRGTDKPVPGLHGNDSVRLRC